MFKFVYCLDLKNNANCKSLKFICNNTVYYNKCFVKLKLIEKIYFIYLRCFLASKSKNFAENKLRETLCEKIGVASPMILFRKKKEKYILIWIDSMCRDSQARRLVVDSLQRNPRATWTSMRPIKMCTALYIERDRSHDTPCAFPMGIFYRGELVRIWTRTRA